MRFIGNKEKLLDNIYQILLSRNIRGSSFFDFFAGTTNVGRYFKKIGYKVYSSDLLYFSFILQKAYIENNSQPQFHTLLNTLNYNSSNTLFTSPFQIVLDFLNNIEPKKGFIFQNYTPQGSSNLEAPRMYFSNENGQKIDAIRIQIEEWSNKNLLTEYEYYILIACLIETVPYYANISGVYSAFQKKWDNRALKPLKLREINLIFNQTKNCCYNQNSVNLIQDIETDILYLDPPYNQRQYAPNYHILETIARYDNPSIYGIAGLRDYSTQKSKFCNKTTALSELEKVIKEAKYSTLILSYNTEGIMPQNDIKNIMNKYGSVELVEFDYLRFKSNNNGESKTKKVIQEQLYILKK